MCLYKSVPDELAELHTRLMISTLRLLGVGCDLVCVALHGGTLDLGLPSPERTPVLGKTPSGACDEQPCDDLVNNEDRFRSLCVEPYFPRSRNAIFRQRRART